MRLLASSLAFVAVLAAPAMAGEWGLSEIRAGVFAHSVDPLTSDVANRINDINFEVLFTAPYLDSFTFLNGQLRPRIGGTINFGGLESMVNLGLTWHVPIADTPFFVEGTLGGALHNGALTGAVAPARNLGCSALFYEAGSLGANFGDGVTAMVTLEHASNAGICAENRGLTNFGVRVGKTF